MNEVKEQQEQGLNQGQAHELKQEQEPIVVQQDQETIKKQENETVWQLPYKEVNDKQQEQFYNKYDNKTYQKKEDMNMGSEYKKLVKSKNRMICGVCGGVGEYFNIDPTIVRILFIVFGFWGAGVIAYIIAAVVIPESGN